jgi:hypothetical protein
MDKEFGTSEILKILQQCGINYVVGKKKTKEFNDMNPIWGKWEGIFFCKNFENFREK